MILVRIMTDILTRSAQIQVVVSAGTINKTILIPNVHFPRAINSKIRYL